MQTQSKSVAWRIFTFLSMEEKCFYSSWVCIIFMDEIFLQIIEDAKSQAQQWWMHKTSGEIIKCISIMSVSDDLVCKNLPKLRTYKPTEVNRDFVFCSCNFSHLKQFTCPLWILYPILVLFNCVFTLKAHSCLHWLMLQPGRRASKDGVHPGFLEESLKVFQIMIDSYTRRVRVGIFCTKDDDRQAIVLNLPCALLYNNVVNTLICIASNFSFNASKYLLETVNNSSY